MTVSAPGKLFVIGEYAVLEGAPALVVALAPGMECHVERLGKGELWELEAPDLGLEEQFRIGSSEPPRSALASLHVSAARAAAKAFGVVDPLRLVVRARDERLRSKKGLGGSSATAATIVGAVARASGAEIGSPEARGRVLGIALDVHRAHQDGRGSGADVAASVHGGWVRYTIDRGQPTTRDAADLGGLRLRLAWTGRDVDTVAAIRDFERLSRSNEASGWRGDLETALAAFWRAVERGDREDLLESLSAYGERLDELRPSGRVRELVGAARSTGAAAKGSGAAGGDCVLAAAFDDSVLDRVDERWLALGAEPIRVDVDSRGLRTEE